MGLSTSPASRTCCQLVALLVLASATPAFGSGPRGGPDDRVSAAPDKGEGGDSPRRDPGARDAADDPNDADGEPALPPQGNYYGAFWGVDLRAGAAFGVADGSFTPDVAVGASFRIAGLMSLIDVDVSGVTSGFSRNIRGADFDERHTRVGVEARLHPLFIRTLEGSWVLAGIHLALGGGLDVLSSVGGGRDRTDFGFAFQWGAGVDVPLTSPRRGQWSLWLGFGWRMRFVGFAHAPAGLRDLGGQDAFVTVGFRNHSIDFMRVPTPPEFNDSDR